MGTTIHQKLFPLLFYIQIASSMISTVSKNLFNVSITRKAKSFAFIFIQPGGETVRPLSKRLMPRHENRIHRRNFEFSEAADRKNWSPIRINRRRKLPKKDVTFGKQFSRFESGEGGSSRRNSNGYCLMAGGGQVCRNFVPPRRFHGLNYRVFEDKTLSNLTIGTWQIIKDGRYIYNLQWPNIPNIHFNDMNRYIFSTFILIIETKYMLNINI